MINGLPPNFRASTTASDLGKLELLLSRKESDVQAAARVGYATEDADI